MKKPEKIIKKCCCGNKYKCGCGIVSYNMAISECQTWIIYRLKKIQYSGMTKQLSFEESSKYYKTEINNLIKEI